MSDCTRCGGRATDSFLCWPCTRSLTQTLRDLPWWLARLTETATGDTRMSDNAGRKSARRYTLDGDTELAAYIDPLPPRKDDLDKARTQRHKAALAHALAAGGVNARASELLATIADSLGYWCRVVAESRGRQYEPSSSERALGANHARWLRLHVLSITAHEDAADIAGDIEGHLEDIVRAVNRPIRMLDFGPCPAWNDTTDDTCATNLRAPQESDTVQCRRCKTVHNCHRLFLDLMAAADRELKTWEELVRFNRHLPDTYRTAHRTLQHWRTTGLLQPREHHGDIPMYSWADVKRLQIAKPQKTATGAAARRVIP